MDVGCYCVSGARFLGGEPRHVAGAQVVGPTGVDILFAGAMLMENDITAHFDCSFVVPERDELEVIGEEGSLFLDNRGTRVNLSSRSGATAPSSESRSRRRTRTGSSSRT